MKKTITIICLAISTIIYGQTVSVSIENLKVNDISQSSSSPIDLGTNPSVYVTFRVDLAKQSDYTIGNSTVWISVFDNSGGRTEHEITPVPQNQFPTGASKSYGFDILASEINFGNGNYLSALLKQDNQPGAEWESDHIPIIKTPAFELSPSSLSLPCGNTSQRTFTVTNGSNLSGIIYQWSVGNGWSGNINNSNSITLTPIDGTILPSNVSVTPIYNGEDQTTLTSIVNRAPFSTIASITGNGSVCSTANYTVNNLPSGVSVTSWSVSDNNIATINENGNQATLTATGNGTVTISATLTNACGQTKVITKAHIGVGAPSFPPYPAMSGDNNPMVGEYKGYSVAGAEGATSYTWYFDVGNGVTGTNVDGWEILSYGYQNKSINVRVGNPGSTVVVCKATNSCGNRIKYKYVTVRSPNDPCGDFRLSSNPMKSGSSENRVIYPPIDPCDNDPFGKTTTNTKKIKTVEIFNSYGERVYLKSQTENEFNLSELKKGFYFVKGQISNGNTITKKLIVE